MSVKKLSECRDVFSAWYNRICCFCHKHRSSLTTWSWSWACTSLRNSPRRFTSPWTSSSITSPGLCPRDTAKHQDRSYQRVAWMSATLIICGGLFNKIHKHKNIYVSIYLGFCREEYAHFHRLQHRWKVYHTWITSPVTGFSDGSANRYQNLDCAPTSHRHTAKTHTSHKCV